MGNAGGGGAYWKREKFEPGARISTKARRITEGDVRGRLKRKVTPPKSASTLMPQRREKVRRGGKKFDNIPVRKTEGKRRGGVPGNKFRALRRKR